MHDIAHEFTSKKVSPWGGIKLFYKTYRASGLREKLSALALPVSGSNRGFASIDLIEGFMVSVVLGARRLAHSGMLRTDEVIGQIFDWKKGMASQSTFSRFFKKFSIERNDAVFTELNRWWFSQMAIKNMTIDVDSTVITRYGRQEGAAVGYNPTKRGRRSHHPLMAFCAKMKMVVNAWMRTGNSNANSDIIPFLEELITIVAPQRIGLLRMDSGFYNGQIMSFLEKQCDQQGIDYIIRAKMTPALQEAVLTVKDWYADDTVQKTAQYGEFKYKSLDWDKPRRMVVVRVPRTQNNQIGQQQMFGYDQLDQYAYTVLVTSKKGSSSEIHGLYNQRADCENRIKELKYDYGIEGFALDDFAGMEAAFRFVMLAYNVMSLFRQKVLTSQRSHQLSTIRFQCIALGSYVVKNGRNKILKLSAEGKRRHFLEKIFHNVEELSPPFHFSNA